MAKDVSHQETDETAAQAEAIGHLRRSLELGHDWPVAILEAMALWTAPEEDFQGRRLKYFIEGEAFDWLMLAERLCKSVDGLLPQHEVEELLFTGQFPASFDNSRFKDLLGVEKYRGYLNYFYGVTAEEMLLAAVEREVLKRHISNGYRHRKDLSEEAYDVIYRARRSELLEKYWEEKGLPSAETMTLTESKEFTYWLFKYRFDHSDKAKTASDTRKALGHLQEVMANSRINLMHEVSL